MVDEMKAHQERLPKQESQFDIVDANLFIFRDAQEKKYKNILVLEDDFFFHKEIRANRNCESVDEFIEGKKDGELMYFLGCLPGLAIPCTTDLKHFSMCGTTTHSVIYSRQYREGLLLVGQEKILDWDVFQCIHRPLSRYMYHMPLCYQLFPVTENSKNWGNQDPLMKYLCSLGFKCMQWMKLDVQVDPGYSGFYFFSKTWMFFLILWIFVLIFSIQQNKIGYTRFLRRLFVK